MQLHVVSTCSCRKGGVWKGKDLQYLEATVSGSPGYSYNEEVEKTCPGFFACCLAAELTAKNLFDFKYLPCLPVT